MSLHVSLRKMLSCFELDLGFVCPPGNLVAIVGPSGAGKTSLMRIIAGLDQPDAGRILLDDTVFVDVEAGLCLSPQKRKLGLVFQEYTLFPHLTVRKNVAFAARNPDRIPELMDMFGVRHLENRKPDAISGGERQRVALCQTLAREPALLLLDEPFSALDVATWRNLRAELKNLKQELHIPMVHVTHDLEEADYLADAILSVDAGHLDPDWLYRQYRRGVSTLPAQPLIPGCVPGVSGSAYI